MTQLWHNGKRCPDGTLDVSDENWVPGEPIKGGVAPSTIIEDRGNGWVDIASPRWWGRDGKNGPLAREHTPSGQPIWGSCREFTEAVKKANDRGDKIQAVRPRDYE